MPHKGLSWFRLKEHFRKTAPIYLAGIIVCLLLSNLLFTTTRPRTPSEQEVLLYLVDSYTETAPLDDLAASALAEIQQIDETLQDVHFESIPFNDPESDYTSAYLIMARMAVGDGDVYLASSIATDYMMNTEIAYPLDEALANGWMEGLDLEPIIFTHPETGESYTAALRLDNVDALLECQAFNNEGAALFIAGNSTNIETAMETAEYVIRTLMEGNYAPAVSEEPAA